MIVGGVVIQGNQFLVDIERTDRVKLGVRELETKELIYEDPQFVFLALNEIALEEEFYWALHEGGYLIESNKKIDFQGTRYRVAVVI